MVDKKTLFLHHFFKIILWLVIAPQLFQGKNSSLVVSELSPSEIAAQNARVAEYFARRLNRARLPNIQRDEFRTTTPQPKRHQIRDVIYNPSAIDAIQNQQPYPIFSYPGVHLIPSYAYNSPEVVKGVPLYQQRLPTPQGWTNYIPRNPCEYSRYPNWPMEPRLN